ncbi:MAG: valine--tRNA ligase [Candidatus Omnitrophota bacterium]
MQELSSQYNPKEVEEKWYKLWAESSLFHASFNLDKEAYSIVIPPPNVTGILHMGHALNNTIQDILNRSKKMRGFEALWMPGTDHAGIATQNVVERKIAKEGLKRQDLGRDEFLKKVWDWKKEHGSTIIHQLKRMGASCDWARERFTMDEEYSKAVIEVFVSLYEKGLIYQGDYIINWCPRCQTALADEEAPHHDMEGKLYYIKYPVKEKTRNTKHETGKKAKNNKQEDYIVVATTRPETMLGDTAVAVNPKDVRYKHLIGKTIILPIIEREIRIIGDDMVDKKFGTGAVKVTPAHDPNDYAVGKRHGLEFINIMHPDGVLNTNAFDYAGMDRFEAREAIIEELKERKLLEKIEEHKHAVGHCYRCHTIIEPYLSKQWFVKMKPLAKPAVKAVEKGEINFHPKRWTKVYLNWMENIRDWCISRQIWWGHRIPVYYCAQCQAKKQDTGVIVSRVRPEKCPVCGSTDLKQDEDVLDTWFSSWLWPFATFGWPFSKAEASDREFRDQDRARADLKYFYPTSTLVTAPEIIFFWVARMIMAGYEFMGDLPFRDIYIHGTVRDSQGRKMSKSLGNSIDPLSIIEEYGADALRFSLIAIGAGGSDIFLSKERFQQGRNFANKIWNASRFILMNIKDDVPDGEIDVKQLYIRERWILAELNRLIKGVTKALDQFKLNEALNLIYEFFWHKFCDWYLEMAKHDIANQNVKKVLLYVLRSTLTLLNPFMPFVTDEIASRLPGRRFETLGCEAWPKEQKAFDDKASIAAMDIVFQVIFQLRNMKIDLNLGLQSQVCVRLSTTKNLQKTLKEVSELIKSLGCISELEITTDETVLHNCLSALAAKNVQMYLRLEGLVDIEKERMRLNTQIDDFKNQLKRKEGMLKNKDFVKKAPKAVVDKEKQRMEELKESIRRLTEVCHGLK